MDPYGGQTLVHFGVFEADLRTGELRKNGRKINVQEQPFQVLAMLLERPGEMIPREELQKRLWPEQTFVDFDTGLNKAIMKIREALDDSAETPRFVETLPRRGYRFIAPVQPVVPFSGRSDLIDSIAVLPFANANADPDAEYLSDGISESLINNLSQLPNLRVLARTTTFRYKGKDAHPQKVGRDLHVRAVLSGRLVQRGNVIVVQAELVDVDKGTQLWGGQYNREMHDILTLQEDLSKEISEKLRLRLTGEETQRLTKRHTENPEAYQLYLKGRYYWNKATPEGSHKAIEYFQQAIDKDPNYALAYAGLADTYNRFAFLNVLPPREVIPKTKATARKALEIDDTLAEPHVALAWVSYSFDWDWVAAGRHLERALALNPAHPMGHVFNSLYLGALGRSEEALAEARHAQELDPVSPAVDHYIAVQLCLARQFDQAIEQCRKTQEMDPNFPPTYYVLGQAYAANGMHREALAEYQRYSMLSRGNPLSLSVLGYAYGLLRERTEAIRVLDELRAASKQRYVSAVSFARIYVGLGEKDQAFAWLERAYEERSTHLAHLKTEPMWDPLRSDPRFPDLMRRIGLPL